MKFLIFNAGSSSLKISVAEDEHITANYNLAAPPLTIDDQQWREVFHELGEITGGYEVVVNRVVHGGERFGSAAIIDDKVQRQIEELTAMAPLHQPPSVFVMDKLRRTAPGAVHVACFDTGFHQTIPEAAYTYAIPKLWRKRFGVRKYGFHGLAHEYNAQAIASMVGRDVKDLKIISAHLGSGASLCAINHGESYDTTMGFTPLDGLVMGTRSGSLDPSVPAWISEKAGVKYETIVDRLSKESGLMGLAGDTHMGHIEDRAAAGDTDAKLALAVWEHRTVSLIGQMAAAMGGVDVLAFSGGIGEHSAVEREAILRRLEWLGFDVDVAANNSNKKDTIITTPTSKRMAAVVESREDLTMIREARRVMRDLVH